MENLEVQKSQDDYEIIPVKKLPEQKYKTLHKKYLESDYQILSWMNSLTASEKFKHNYLKGLTKDVYSLKFELRHKGKMIGWTYGWQDSNSSDFYIASSLVIPEHRNKGLYTRMLLKVLEQTKKDGFNSVRSRHHCTNNPIIIAKLKCGFTINGFEQDEVMGTLVRMVYHHNEKRKKASLFRAGKLNEASVFDN